MHKKGQNALEYLFNYSWIILIIAILGVAFWQMGVFSPGVTGGATGFGKLKPLEYYCKAKPGAGDTVTILVANVAGRTVSNVSITVEGLTAKCSPEILEIGSIARCNITNVECGADSPAERYEVDVGISYSSPTGGAISSGTIWGPAD